MKSSKKDHDPLKMQLNIARLVEYSVSFLLTLLISIVLLNRVRCQLEGFTYLVMAILLFT